MSKVAKDTPIYLLELLRAVDYSKITEAQYNDWKVQIDAHIGKHLKRRLKPAVLVGINIHLRQDFCDLINQYDFSGLSFKKQMMLVPLVKRWAAENLPLLHAI